ncbi:MAG: 50S ribosomal protein L15 [Gemmatimonadetes bacterium]|nr:50S ribosomal protein L15 [Gemmatimonadota bacterium]NIU76554.1 50S ribosomal protein L15 [Gammaproteobacteria bacterium]NIQ56361.1 50S ribosomal protein L15 [Gemmatimonadota bacterium]NIW35267.1 50S ribosomal protein L15 [Gemmatimonadota bacterium]NIX46007.1 50S ribosomal protein L15 [Gemmatimonadota bacterium]
MADLNNLRRPKGASRDSKRVGRGPGSGSGKTSSRGHKGQKARSGARIPAWFEGGQMPLQRRVPKRGFTSRKKNDFEIVNVKDLGRIAEDPITPAILHQNGLVDLGKGLPVKVLGKGELEKKVTVKAHAVSEGARKKIEEAGGTVEILEE